MVADTPQVAKWRPDYEILQTIIQYFQDYPESCHHPKEEMIFES